MGKMSNPQRKWVSIIGGGLFGFGMSQVLILILATGVYIRYIEAFVWIIIGFFIGSTFLGSILAGVIDKDEADIRGIQAALIAWGIYLTYDLVLLLFFGLHDLYIAVDYYMIFIALIPTVVLGGIGGKIGGSLRSRYRKLK